MLTLGADPEFFVRSSATSEVVPIIGLLGGTKEKPRTLGGGFAVQEDNVMAEYNVPVATDSYTFADNVLRGRAYALDILRQKDHRLDTHMECSVLFPFAQLEHPQAQTFGCSPDFDGHAQGQPLPRVNPRALYIQGRGAWRFAGGHVHIGISDLGWECPPFVIAALCDVFLSIPMIARGGDTQGERRKWYGTPGRYRPTPYGIEYRTLSNQWTMVGRECRNVGRSVESMYHNMLQGEEHIRRLYNDLPWIDIRRAIATEDVSLCTSLRDYFRSHSKLEVI